MWGQPLYLHGGCHFVLQLYYGYQIIQIQSCHFVLWLLALLWISSSAAWVTCDLLVISFYEVTEMWLLLSVSVEMCDPGQALLTGEHFLLVLGHGACDPVKSIGTIFILAAQLRRQHLLLCLLISWGHFSWTKQHTMGFCRLNSRVYANFCHKWPVRHIHFVLLDYSLYDSLCQTMIFNWFQ